MNKSSSSPAVSNNTGLQQLSMQSGSACAYDTSMLNASLDLSTVADRSRLPIGVGRDMASRMRLDATMNPLMLDMRMNNQNLKKELDVQRGKIVSHQFALMRPRQRATIQKPKDLVLPHYCSKEVVKKFARLAKEQESVEQASVPVVGAKRGAVTMPANTVLKALQGTGSFENKKKEQKSMKPLRSMRVDVSEEEVPVDDEVMALLQGSEIQLEMNRLFAIGRVTDTYKSLETSPGAGLRHDRVARSLSALGFRDPDKNIVKGTVKRLSPSGANLSLDEFCKVVIIFDHKRRKAIREKFEELDQDKSGAIDARELRHLLWDLGYTVSMDTVEQIVKEVDNDISGEIELDEFEETVALINDRHGFTKQETADLDDLFRRYDTEDTGVISASELASILGYFGTPTTILQAKAIIKQFDSDDDGTLTRPEFLRVMRLRLEQEIADIHRLFAEYDQDGSGYIDMGEMLLVAHQIGYTVMPEVIDETVKDTVVPLSAFLVFEDALQVLRELRKREGFSKAEASYLREVFRQHDGLEQGILREFELERAVNWLGYPLSCRRRRQLWCRVDVDKTDSIDENEFLKLIRLLREEETEASSKLLEKTDAKSNKQEPTIYLKESGLREILNKLGYSPSQALLTEALSVSVDSNGDGQPDLLGVLGILQFIREREVKILRQSSGLPDTVTSKVRARFNLEGSDYLKPADFEKLMMEMFKQSKTRTEEMSRIRAVIDEHTANKELGSELSEAFRAVRDYADKVSEDVWKRERLAAKEARFTAAQVAQFREAFVAADEDGSGCLSDPEIQKVFDNVVKLNIVQAQTLRRELSVMNENEELIDFPDFLRLMRVVGFQSIQHRRKSRS
eukprot:TRINITY_DN54638_c0_g1_i1.p1 TRINITY_DN54638_c0_g1~~TRINITY_DN54638_c0_g1_i1.p1  ORF type:complete len:853 (-),score=201.59 TRINITY_DN54638_c0_g1_i1:33-2591(-)